MREHAPGGAELLLDDWFLTTRWYERLRRGETLHGMATGYRAARAGP